jgi:bla regulator protein BlaR1
MESIIFKTLLHSLWQGVLLAVITAVIILLTTNSTARLRYNLFVGCLVLFVASVAGTFLLQLSYSGPEQELQANLLSGSLHAGSSPVKSIASIEFTPGVLDHVIGYLSRYSAVAVLIWLLIICAKSIRFMIDVRTLFQMKNTKVYAAGTMLETKVKQLSSKYEIYQKVKIMQSGMVQVPMVLGHLKPLILVPLGLINGLSAEEVEAILSHELAHIKRRDYLVNLMQSMVEILFFFNPAVLWISNLIRTERENCCDDLAVSTTQTKVDYIRALVSCQEFASAVPAYAMAVSGGKSNLVNRVQRLISARNQSLNKIEKAVLAVVLVSSIILTSAFSGKSSLQHAVISANDQLHTSVVPAPNQIAKNPADAVTADAKTVRNERDETTRPATPATVQEPVSATQSSIYAQLVKDHLINPEDDVTFRLDNESMTINGVKQNDKVFQAYKSAYIKSGRQTISYTKKVDNKGTDSDKESARRAAVRAQSSAQASVESQQEVAERAEISARRAQVAAQHAAVAGERSQHAAAAAQAVQVAVPINMTLSAKVQKEAEASLAQATIAQQNAAAAQVKARQAEKQALKVQIEARKGNNMTNDLIAEGLIRNKGNFKYKLNREELVIDGEQQSAEVHRRYMRKYLKSPNQTITTSVNTD